MTVGGSPLLPAVEQGSPAFDGAVRALLDRGTSALAAVEPAARQIVNDVRHGGDAMVLRYAERMDGKAPAVLFERSFDGEGAMARLPREVGQALKAAAGRVRRFHQHQREAGFRYEEAGMVLGQRARPVRRAAVCAPVGKARSPLGVLMAAMPAQVAGVSDLLLAAPEVDDLLLAAAHLSGVTALVHTGGAQAVAALAFGTASIPQVDVIVGECDLHAACAKRLVFGHVHVDGLGGPPELFVLADASAQVDLVAIDLLAAAEADEAAYPVLLTTERRVAMAVQQELTRQLPALPRHAIAAAALARGGAALVVRQREQLLALADQLAPAQVALHVERPEDAFDRLRSVGAAVWGAATPGVAGGLLGGPSSVLPTGGAARFWGGLGVGHFLTRTSFAQFSPLALRAQVDAGVALTRFQGHEARARSLELRRGVVNPGRRELGR